MRTLWTRIHALSSPWHSTGIGQAAALALTIAAVAWAIIGFGVAIGASGNNPPTAPHNNLPLTLRASFWLIGALACVVVLLTRRWAAVACGLLMVGPVQRVASYTWAWVSDIIGQEGYSSGWYSAAVHIPLVGLVGLIALLTRMTHDEGITR